ncbi:putative zinc-ribbon domain plant [Arabidopsis thaliana x Arabidopsis arenosa]|uniref:Putative zinc-ribbon domain plant n=2 Tax=Arabidopsis thaliana x Arabidopsis arenosa TaxID=1240361 RepID=A0A8T2ACN5_9BRAS|nr:putative zinc-ribbon domain plant [Arabidopsis thaliana x Arabidopsis arenosa]
MAESSTIQVSLVRCPKCKNLLQEPKDCPFFQCGGCGTVLCAKNKDREADLLSVKSVENRAKETQVNSGSIDGESDSDASLRHQQNGQTETWDVHSDPTSKLNVVDPGNNDSQPGLDRLRQRTTKRCDFQGFRFSTSNYFTDSLSSDEAIEQDRAGLVRKLDKLKEQLVQPKEQQIPSSSSGFEKAPLRVFSSGKHIAGPSCYRNYPEPEPPCLYNNNTDISQRGPMYNPAHVPAYGDPHGFQTHERTLQPSHLHNSRQYIGNNGHDLFDTHPGNGMFHQSTCSCSHCYDPYHRASGSVFPPSGLPDALRNAGFYPHERSFGFGTSLHGQRTFIPPGSQSPGPQLQRRCPSGFKDTGMNAISRVHPSKRVSSSGGSRLIHPVAGGAPFINCINCFKLLKLPDKIDSATRKKQKMRCGACSCVIDYTFVDKKLILSTDPASARKAETHSSLRWETTANFSSDDYDNAAYEFHAMDRGPADVSTGLALISNKAQEMQIADSTSPSVSEDELSSDSSTVRKVTPDSPLQKHFEYSSINIRDRSGPRSRSSRSEQDRVTSKTAMRQNSMKEASDAIEMDVNDYSHNNEVSQDSANDYTFDQGRTKKGRFASIVKNSFKDLKKSIQNEGRSDVSINGHPVAERLVKMAEKQAGPIRPGNYWYDYRAGFWGVMGSHCLGILPPFIEELNYPMPENCSGGTTRVFVNGRELHQKDLRLLTARGLPRDRDRSYTVYISGRVIDEDTGEELDSLGKLAPTVDKLKRGFGMRVPRRAA